MKLWPVVMVMACATSTPQGEAPAERRALSPVSLSWQNPVATGSRLALTAHIARVTAVPVPLAVSLTLPQGVTLVRGEPTLMLRPNAQADAWSAGYEFEVAPGAVGDLVLHADGDTKGMGYHLHSEFHFGPEAVAPAAVKADGPALQINGRDLGPSVPLSK